MVINCCVSTCKNNWFTKCKGRKDLKFYRVPRRTHILWSKYNQLLKTDGINWADGYARICSDHWCNGERKGMDDLPNTNLPSTSRQKPARKPPAVRAPLSVKQPKLSKREHQLQSKLDNAEHQLQIANMEMNMMKEKIQIERQNFMAAAELSAKEITKLKSDFGRLKAENEKLKFTIKNFLHDDTDMRFWTNLTGKEFNTLYDFLKPFTTQIKYPNIATTSTLLGKKDELFLSLVKCKHGHCNADLSSRFNVSPSTVSRIFSAWMVFAVGIFDNIDIFPEEETLELYTPSSLPEMFSNLRLILDATEIPIEKPSNCDMQKLTWSSYKNTNTCKGLVGMTPYGAPCVISNLYPGSISDAEITKKSGACSRLKAGSLVMADKGFLIQDELVKRGISLNIPPFKTKDQFTPTECFETFAIASSRIHVERVIGRVKNWHILEQRWPVSQLDILNYAWKFCVYLLGFLPPIGPKR